MIKTISFYKDTEIAHNHSVNTMPDDEYFSFHTHDICEIIYLKSGNISAIIGEKTYKVPKGSIIIFRANLPHRIRIDGDEHYERHNVLFNENILANGILFKLPNELNVVNCSENNRFSDRRRDRHGCGCCSGHAGGSQAEEVPHRRFPCAPLCRRHH